MFLINLIIALIILCSNKNQFIECQHFALNTQINILNNANITLNSDNINSTSLRMTSRRFGRRGYKIYTLGERMIGDKLIAEKSDHQSYPSAQDVEVTLKYPDDNDKNINAWKITYVNILVEQTSSIGNGYVIDGGVQEEFIAVRLEADQTLYFSYLATFYGY